MPRSHRRSLAALALAGLVAGGCSAGIGGLPNHREMNGYPAALLEATLVHQGECLYAISPDGNGRWLPLWPPGFGLSGNDLVKDGRRIASVGDRVKLGGGEYHATDYDFVRTLMTSEIPAACRGGDYWLVGEVAT